MKNRTIKVDVELSSSGVIRITQAFFDCNRRLIKMKVDNFPNALGLRESFNFALEHVEGFVWPGMKK